MKGQQDNQQIQVPREPVVIQASVQEENLQRNTTVQENRQQNAQPQSIQQQDSMQRMTVGPAEDFSTIRRTQSLMGEEAELPFEQLRSRASYREASAVTQRRRERLLAGLPLQESQQKKFIKDRDKWEEIRKREAGQNYRERSKEDFKWFHRLAGELLRDEEAASGSFQEVKDAVRAFSKLLLENQEVHTMQGSYAAEYEEAYERINQAVAAYLSSHSFLRFTSSGRRRKKLIKELSAQLKQHRQFAAECILSFSDLEEFRDRCLSGEEQGEIDTQREAMQEQDFSKAEIRRIIADGTPLDRINALRYLEKWEGVYAQYYDARENKTRESAEYVELKQKLVNIIDNAPLQEQAEYVKIVTRMQLSVFQRLEEAYENYRASAPEGVDAEAYAAVRLKDDPIALEYTGTQGCVEALTFGLPKASTESISKMIFFVRGQRLDKFGAVMDRGLRKPEETEILSTDRGAYLRRLPEQLQRELGPGKADEWAERMVELGFAIPPAMEQLSLLAQRLFDDAEEASPSFQEVQDTMHRFLDKNHIRKQSQIEYAQAWKAAKDALIKYRDTHSTHRFSEKGERRQNLINQLLKALPAEYDGLAEAAEEARKRYPNVSDRIIYASWKCSKLQNDSKSSLLTEEQYARVEQNVTTKRGVGVNSDRNVYGLLKHYQRNMDGEPLTEEDRQKKQWNEGFAEETVSEEKAEKPYLNDVMEEMVNVEVLELDKLKDMDWVFSHLDEVLSVSRLFLRYNNLKNDEKNRAYFAQLPEWKKELLEVKGVAMSHLTTWLYLSAPLIGVDFNRGVIVGDGTLSQEALRQFREMTAEVEAQTVEVCQHYNELLNQIREQQGTQ